MRRYLLFFVCLLFCSSLCAEKTIAIFLNKHAQGWGPESVKTGIPGSEEAVIYMADQLAKLGYKVYVLGKPMRGSPHRLCSANPRYVSLNFDDGTVFDVGIAWRMPDAAQRIKQRARTVYFWPEDLCEKVYTEEQINSFDGVLWISEYERQQYISKNPAFAKFTHIYGNGVPAALAKPIQPRENPYSCIWGSNYARGLDILLDIWPEVKKHYPKATLDIYYGWQHWGCMSKQKEAQMRAQVLALAPLGVQEHGMVGHDELTQAYERASLWTYPCTALETFCTTAIRAQLAGAIPVIIDGSALKETVRHGYRCATKEEYLAMLLQTMSTIDKVSVEERQKMSSFIVQEYTWEVLAKRWQELFESTPVRNEPPKRRALTFFY